MVRNIVKIDADKCNRCGACASACHEGAIGMINGKAVLLKEDYCDGLGNCLPACPTGAITIEQREAADFDEEAVKNRQNMLEEIKERLKNKRVTPTAGGCPGAASRMLHPRHTATANSVAGSVPGSSMAADSAGSVAGGPGSAAGNGGWNMDGGELSQWPIQIKLVPLTAPYFQGADLLIAADCTAFAYANFHQKFIRGRITLIGCPKLDEGDYTEKLTAIIKANDIRSVTIVRMEVPCCGGLEMAAKNAIKASGKFLPWHVAVVSAEGQILSE